MERDIVECRLDAIKCIPQLPPHAPMEYKPHQNSIQDKSSFRNTQVWKIKLLEGGMTEARETTTRHSGSWGEGDTRPKGRDSDFLSCCWFQ
jgi:hypothetical protein